MTGRAPPRALWTLLRFELKMLLRDRRTILIAVVAPLFLFPALIFVMRSVEQSEERRLEEATYEYALKGSLASWARPLVSAAATIDPDSAADEQGRVQFEERVVEDADSALLLGDLDVLVEALSATEIRRMLQDDVRKRREAGVPPDSVETIRWETEAPVIRLHYRAPSDFSSRAAGRLQERLREVRSARRDSIYIAAGFEVALDRVGEIELLNTATEAEERGAVLGRLVAPFLIFLMLTGGSIVAADAISGEKERGTLETLLTTAARRSEIVESKELTIIIVGLAIGVVNILNLLFYVVLDLFELPAFFQVSLSLVDLLLLFVLLLPLTILVASSLLLLSGYAKTYREYQIYFFPLLLVFVALTGVSFLPGMDLRSAIAFVPVAGIGMAVREVMTGEYDLLFLTFAFFSTGVAAWISERVTLRTLSTERLITSAELDEADLVRGPAIFPRHVLG